MKSNIFQTIKLPLIFGCLLLAQVTVAQVSDSSRLTPAGVAPGTPGYKPTEQGAGAVNYGQPAQEFRQEPAVTVEEARASQRYNRDREKAARRAEKAAKALEKNARRAEKASNRAQKLEKKAVKAEQKAAKARERSRRQEQKADKAIERYQRPVQP